MLLLIRWQKLLLNFYSKATSQSLENWPCPWGSEGPPLRATSSVSCVSSWAFWRQEPCHTTPRPTDRWSESTKHWCRWFGNWVKIGRQTGFNHLPKLVHTYNSMRSDVTGYSPHYWCFAWPSTFYFPIILSTEKHQCVNHYIADLCEGLCKAFKEVQVQSSTEAERQRQYYEHKASAISLKLGDLVLTKANAYKGRRKEKDW